MRQQYFPKKFKFRRDKGALVEHANIIIAEYQTDGLILTLRQLYYQFVARDLLPNSLKSYKRLGEAVNDGRLNGDIDWDAIEDRTRNLRGQAHWDSPADIIESAAYSHRINKWAGQDHHVEIWVEKEALSGVFDRICAQEDVALMACRGYMSQSEIRVAGLRLGQAIARGQQPVVLHFGDHDPSGIDMTRDVRERLSMFAEGEVQVERLALNFDQVVQYEPPPNPAKTTDSRFESYAEKFGHESWELDALNPRVLVELVTSNIKRYRNQKLWNQLVRRESRERDLLQKASLHWPTLVSSLEEMD